MIKQAAHHLHVASTAGLRKRGVAISVPESGIGSPLEESPDHLQLTFPTGAVESGAEAVTTPVDGCPLVQEVEDDSQVAMSRRNREGLVSFFMRGSDETGIHLDQPLDLR